MSIDKTDEGHESNALRAAILQELILICLAWLRHGAIECMLLMYIAQNDSKPRIKQRRPRC